VKVKKSMSSLDLYSWLKWCRDRILNCYIDNIYMPKGNLIILKLKCKSQSFNLVIEASRRIHLTKYTFKTTETEQYKIPLFCTILRRKIRDKKILNIYQYDFERVVIVEIGRVEPEYKLIAEILPRGVIVLTDRDNTIIYASEFREMKDRSIKVKEKYTLPPRIGIDITSLSPKEITCKVKEYAKSTIVRGLVRALGIPGELAEEICYRAGIDKNRRVETLNTQELNSIVKALSDILSEVNHGKGYIVYDGDTPITVTPYKPVATHGRIVEYQLFNDALDEYFTYYMRLEEELSAREKVEEEIARLETSLRKQCELIEKYRRESEKYKRIADKLMMNLHILSEFLKCIRSQSENWYKAIDKCKSILNETVTIKSINPSKGLIKVTVNGDNVDLDVRLSAYDNISKLYSLAKEFKVKAERAKEALSRLEEKIRELKSRMELETVKARVAIKRREWYEKYHWLITPSGFLVIAGRDQSQNESLVRKHLKDDDIFLHADIHGAPATILKVEGSKPSSRDIEEAALLAAVYSKAWKLGLHVVDVFWVYGKQVSKSPPSGEYLPKGAFMVYGKKNYIRNVALKLALGIEIYDNSYRVIVGSEDTVKSKTKYYTILIPGDEDPYTVARKVKEKLLSKCSEREKYIIESVDLNEIAMRIPGKSRIVE